MSWEVSTPWSVIGNPFMAMILLWNPRERKYSEKETRAWKKSYLLSLDDSDPALVHDVQNKTNYIRRLQHCVQAQRRHLCSIRMSWCIPSTFRIAVSLTEVSVGNGGAEVGYQRVEGSYQQELPASIELSGFKVSPLRAESGPNSTNLVAGCACCCNFWHSVSLT